MLVPMAEIAADFVHPTLDVTVETLTARVQGREGVRWYGPPPELEWVAGAGPVRWSVGGEGGGWG